MASHRIRDVRSVLLLVSMLSCASVFALNTSDYAVLVSASVQASPPQITLSWPAASDGTSYSVSRKLLSDTTWGTAVGIGTNLTYTDTSVSVGNTYEYRVIKTGSSATGYGYIAVGLQAPLIENRGTVVLVVENTYASDLSSELTRLQQDLVGDGWTVVRRDVSRTDTVVSVKNTIKAVYDADPTNVKAVFLFGRVPVPYSGNTAYDGHGDHQGAWPSDTFYGEMNGTWTDTSVNNTTPSRNENDNIPGDGKYDQSSIPSDMELQVGRVDLYNMPAFAPKTEKDLLRQYLNKDHNFRHKIIDAQRRGLIDDNFGTFSGEAFAASGWRNFAPFFGASNVFSLDWFGTLPSNSYMWAYGCGGGWYQGSSGVGNTSQFASNDTQAVFNILFGSYNGDWDANDAFLRAPLATTTYGLTCAWAGRPHWFFHHMGAGLNIGYSARITQNNNYGGLYQANNFGTRGTHVNLMGDPTLRMHIVAPPSGFTATSGTGVSLSWTASTDTVVGYHVYRSANATGPFTRLTTNLVTGTSYTDSSPPAGALTYMVRAVKLESTPSGSYYNPSQGIFAAVTPPPTQPPVAPSGLTATANSAVRINLSWTDNSNNETQFKIERKTGAAGTWGQIGTVGGNITTYVDTTVAYGTQYYYRVRASNSIGNSAPSNEANATTNAGVGPGTGTGLTGDYYDNMDFTALKLTRTDATVNFDFGGGSPDASVGADTFSVRWRGQVQARFTETYTFYVTSDDGVRLWVNNQQLVNNWVDQGPTERSGTLAVVAGQKYDIVMEYYENGGGAVAKLAWSSLSTNKETIPQTQLYPVGAPPTPGVPGSLSANAVSKSQIDLTWTDTANNENGFKIERKTGAAGTFAQIGTAGANATSYSDTTVAPDTTYYYQVRAYNGSGDSAYSNIASATTPALVSDAEFVTQSVPTALTTGDTANVTVEMKNTGETTWAIGTFQLYAQSPAGNSTWGLSSVDVTAATAPGASVTFSFSITAPATAGTYVFEWRMLDKAKGEFGQASTSVSIIVSAPTPPPPPNGSPTLTSGVTASPSTVVVNQPVTFSVGASDPNGDPLTTTWNFGDGSASSTNGTHTYTVAGNYTVTATISDGNGGVLTSTAAITVNAASTGGGGTPGGGGGSGGSGGSGATAPTDTDNDGFADEIDEDDDNDGVSDANESLDGTNSLSASSVNKLPMTITKLRGIAKFGVGGKDGYQLSGILPNVPAGLNPFGQIVSIDFAGAPRTFTLDSKGRARATGGSFQLKLKGKRNKLTKLVDYAGGDIPFKATVKGTFVEAWADEGITPEASGKLPLAFSVEMIFNGRVYAGTVSAVFSAKTGTGGSFQSAKPPKK